MYGLAAVSKEPSPFPMIKMAAQNPPKDRARMQGQATNAPIPDFKFVNIKSQEPVVLFTYRTSTSPR